MSSSRYVPTADEVAALQEDQERALDRRMRNLREICTDQFELERNLLKKPWQDPDVNRRPDFSPADGYELGIPPMYGVRNILDDLSQFITARFDTDDLDEWFKFVETDEWKSRSGPFLGLYDDKLNPVTDSPTHILRMILQEGYDVEPFTFDLFSDKLPWFIEERVDPGGKTWVDVRNNRTYTRKLEVPDTTIWNLYDTAQLWKPVRDAWALMMRLRTLRRFADFRNPKMDEKPLPDGSNINPRSPALLNTWVLHRVWMRLLHYRSLDIETLKIGRLELEYVEQLSLLMLVLEMQDVPRTPVQGNTRPFRSIIETYENLFDSVTLLLEFMATETRDDGVNYTLPETCVYNISPDVLRPYMENFLLPQLNAGTDPLWKMWSLLLSKAAEFDIASDAEHVEDVLVAKRVVIEDEYYWVTQDLQSPYDAVDVYDKKTDTLRFDEIYGENTVKRRLKCVSEINRFRRNKLLMTHWSGSRPWKQLYIMYDTTPTGQPELAALTERFWLKIEQIEMAFPNPPSSWSPSNKANIWKNLFPIHPLASTDPISEGRLGRFYEPRCSICLDEYTETTGKVLVRLHCGHWFHFMCFRDFVDEPDLIAIRCPVCRKDWKLHQHSGITPEVRALDVWDYEDVCGANWIFGGGNGSDPHPDISDQYNGIHEQIFAMSYLWSDTTGYPTVDGENPFNVDSEQFLPGGGGVRGRLPRAEMALYREARRSRNRDWRKAVIDAGRGFSAMEPADVDDLL